MVVDAGAGSKENDHAAWRAPIFEEVEEAREFLRLVVENVIEVLKILRYLRYVLNLIIHFRLVHLVELLNTDLIVFFIALPREYPLILRPYLHEIGVAHATLDQIFELGRHGC